MDHKSQPDVAMCAEIPDAGYYKNVKRVRSQSCSSIGSTALQDSSRHVRTRRRLSGSDASRRSSLQRYQARPSYERYTYRPLPVGSCFRVLRLLSGQKSDPVQCSLRETTLKDASGKYDAVSYVWRPEDEREHVPDQTIDLEGHPLEIRANLFTFLISSRSATLDLELWIDAICIDQNNTEERNHQVQRMTTIYKSARQTRIWLGQCDPCINACLLWFYWAEDSLRHSAGRNAVEEALSKFPRFLHQNAVSAICDNPYWKRLWIIQEVVLSSSLLVQILDLSFPWEFMLRLNKIRRFNRYGRSDEENDFRRNMSASMMYRLSQHRRDRLLSTLPNLIREYSKCHCYDDRDRVFGLLGLAKQNDICVDYNLSKLELFCHVMHSSPPEYLEKLAVPLASALRISDEVQASGEAALATTIPVRLKNMGVTTGEDGSLAWEADPRLLMLVHSFKDNAIRRGRVLYSLVDAWGLAPGHARFLIVLHYTGPRASHREKSSSARNRTWYEVAGTALLLHPGHAMGDIALLFERDMKRLAQGAQAWMIIPDVNMRGADGKFAVNEMTLELPLADFAKMSFARWP